MNKQPPFYSSKSFTIAIAAAGLAGCVTGEGYEDDPTASEYSTQSKSPACASDYLWRGDVTEFSLCAANALLKVPMVTEVPDGDSYPLDGGAERPQTHSVYTENVLPFKGHAGTVAFFPAMPAAAIGGGSYTYWTVSANHANSNYAVTLLYDTTLPAERRSRISMRRIAIDPSLPMPPDEYKNYYNLAVREDTQVQLGIIGGQLVFSIAGNLTFSGIAVPDVPGQGFDFRVQINDVTTASNAGGSGAKDIRIRHAAEQITPDN